MPVITLPDGSQRTFANPVTIEEIAADIGPGLAKATLAGRVNGALVDASFVISDDADVAIVTSKDEDALELMRHDAAHVMAQAVQELFPGTQVTIGPAIENGFYYDFAREEPFSSEDFEKIEKKMSEIVDADYKIMAWDEMMPELQQQIDTLSGELEQARRSQADAAARAADTNPASNWDGAR